MQEFIDDCREMAYGELNLTPAVFWALTAVEFLELCDGYDTRVRIEAGKLALLINAHLYAKPIKAEDLAPPERKTKRRHEKTAEEKRKEYDDMKKRLRS